MPTNDQFRRGRRAAPSGTNGRAPMESSSFAGFKAAAINASVPVADGAYLVDIEDARVLPVSRRGAVSVRLDPVLAETGEHIRLELLCVHLENAHPQPDFAHTNARLLTDLAAIGGRNLESLTDVGNLIGIRAWMDVLEATDYHGMPVNRLIAFYPPDADDSQPESPAAEAKQASKGTKSAAGA